MNDFTVEDIISFIHLSHTLSDKKKEELAKRVLDELEANNNKISPKMGKELAALFEKDLAHVEKNIIPAREEKDELRLAEYDYEIDSAQPELQELVSDYELATQELYSEYNEEFLRLDKAFDEVAQEEIGQKEEDQIHAIHARLKKK
jgi:hypothetical protein